MNLRVKNQNYKFIILALLLVGITVGYAVLSSSSSINGLSKIRNAEWDIHFENVVVSDNSVPIVVANNDKAATIDSEDTTKVSFAITLDKPGDFYEFTVDAINDGSMDAMVETVVSKMNNEVIDELPNYLNYSVTYINGTPITANHLLAANTSETYKVRVEYNKDIENDEVVGEEISLNFDFTVNYRQATDGAVGLVNYQVVHRYETLENTYEEETENLRGEGGTSVTPALRGRTGFVSPETQTEEINPDGSTVFTYTYTRNIYHFSITDRTYVDANSSPDDDYKYGTELYVKAQEREGFNFRWSDNDTNYERTITLTGDLTLTTIYSNNTYVVTLNAGDGSVSPATIDVQIGSAIGDIPAPSYPGYYLEGWFTSQSGDVEVTSSYIPTGDMEIFARWKKSIESATITNSSISIAVGEEEAIVISNANEIEEEYSFSSLDDTVASVTSQGVVTGEAVGNTTITITGNSSGATKTVSVEISAPLVTEYTITLNANGGQVDPSELHVNVGSPIGNIPTPQRDNYTFAGWYTGYSTGIEVDGTYIPQSNMDLIARWDKIICVRATNLHTEECTRTSDGCYSVGYRANGAMGTSTITYGKIPLGSFSVGNAYNCDLNDDGIYRDDTERFYYLGASGDNAVLIFYSNFEGEDGIAITNNFNYSTALTKLPTTTQWNGLNVSFDNDRAARFANPSEIEAACNVTVGTATVGELDNCIFLFENSRFSSTSTGRTAFWLTYTNSKYYRIMNDKRDVTIVQSTSKNVVRPVIEVGVNYIDNTVDANSIARVTFETLGGEYVAPIEVVKNTAIGTLPTTTLAEYTFGGWFTDTSYSTEITASTIITNNMKVYAKWNGLEGVAVMNGVGYSTLASAISNAPSTNTTIRLLEDVEESVSIPSSKNIILNLENHSITSTSGAAITNQGTLELKNGTINCDTSTGAINNESNGDLKISDLNIYATGSKQAIYNNGGTLEINGNGTLSAVASDKATVHNLANGSVTILGGTIISSNYEAVKNESGTLVIGSDDGINDSDTPVIQGRTYGVNGVAYSFYDGIIKGVTAAVQDESLITKDIGSDFVHDTETINSLTYHTLYLNMLVNKYRIIYDPNGGELETTSYAIDAGDPLGELPVPTKGVYTFDGWYTGLTDGIRVDETVVPTASVTYYARWRYIANDSPVAFDMVNDPMKVYYQNISTWKNDETNFQTVMKNNFDNYNCQCTDNTCTSAGTVLCDKPKAYDTHLQEPLNVYLYDTVNSTKGTQVFYTKSENGIIYNMIPGVTYYWETVSDTSVYGLVTPSGERRLLSIDGVRNLRDLGGLEVDSNNDGITDGVLKYGRLIRGEKLGTNQAAIPILESLGITEELELRNTSEIASNEAKFTNYKHREIKHYQIDREHYLSNYNLIRGVLVEVMQDVIDGENIYFHCRIGADRTGTLAYILEGLLQVKDEERLQDYEMTFFFGLINRHRYFSTDPTSSVSKTEKFVYMHNFMVTANDIYNWFMEGSTDVDADNQLIANFRTAMITAV